MQVFIITPFPAIPESVISQSILRRANEKGILDYHVINLREYAEGKNQKIDDYPFGGGSGMVMLATPILKAVKRARELYTGKTDLRVIFPSPQAPVLTQKTSRRFSIHDGIVFICGHYKGIDERVRESVVTDEISMNYISGSKVSWKEDLAGASFVIDNPNATSNCGCGTSFSIT